MPLFCSICQNLLVVSTTADTFHFKCVKCESVEKPDERDTLRYENISGTNLTSYKAILLTAGKDPVNPKVRRECKCGSNVVRQVRLGNEMRLINTCISCNDQWLDGTRETDLELEEIKAAGEKITKGKASRSKGLQKVAEKH